MWDRRRLTTLWASKTCFYTSLLSLYLHYIHYPCGSLPWNPPHVANIDNLSATVLIFKCSLLCNNIPIATHTRNSTAPSLLWYGLVNSAQQRTAFSNDPTGVLYSVHLKTSREIYVVETSVSTMTWTSADANSEQDLQGSSATLEEAQTDCITSVNKVLQQLISRIIVWLQKSYIRMGKLLHPFILG
jgi:hypothetical protein